jgi:GT2 family glycosyltransferase
MRSVLAVITVVYEHYELLDDYLASLRKQSDKNFHLIVVDVSKNKKNITIKDIPNTIVQAENHGYADALNVGVAQAQEEGYTKFCLMNDDTYFEKDFVKNVSDSIDKHPGSMIGGKIYYAPGFEYHKERYSKKDIGKVFWFAGGKMDWKNAFTLHTGVDEVDKGQYDTLREISFLTGCVVCYDQKVFEKVGEWDTTYFMFYEDADLSARAAQKGVKIYYDPSIVIWHKSGQSSEGGYGSEYHRRMQEKNRVKFGLKYAPWKTKFHLVKNFLLEKIKSK